VLHMPIAVSIHHLQDIISEHLSAKVKESGEHVAIPSLEWIRYQFWPQLFAILIHFYQVWYSVTSTKKITC